MPRRRQYPTDDLSRLDLSKLDLDHIQLDEVHAEQTSEEPTTSARPWRWLVLLALVSCGAALLWLPHTEYYRLQGTADGLFFLICGVAVLFGVMAARWLWEWGEEAAVRYAARQTALAPRDKPDTQRPPSAALRWTAFLLAAGGAAAIVFGAPDGGYLSGGGSGYSGAWFWAAGGAVAVGILAGRWIILHSSRPGAPRRKRAPIQTPPWLKWVTLAGLVGLGLFTAFGADFLSSDDQRTLEFTLGGVGFIVGVLGAIWLARRFDETEAKIKEQTRQGKRQT